MTVGYSALIGLAVCLLFPFLAIALYSSPFTDDFCMSSHSLLTTLAEVEQYYVSVGGRLPAYFLITVPSDLAHLTGLDLYMVYPIVMLVVLVAFIVSMSAAAVMVFGQTDRRVSVLFGLLFSCLMLGLVPNLDEFAYWMPGTACYLAASIGACLYAGWLTKITLSNAQIDRYTLTALVAICFITAALNEFTVFFLLGLACLSLAVRLLFAPRPAQVGSYLAMFAAICAGYLIVLVAPGNSHRFALFPESRDIVASIQNASLYTLQYAVYLSRLPEARAFAVLTACFAVATNRARKPALSLIFIGGLFLLAIAWAYTSYFIGAFSTGTTIPPRARNEILIVFSFACAIVEIVLIQVTLGPRLRVPNAYRFWIIAAGTLLILPVRRATNYEDIRSEWPQLATFWQENLARNLLLSTTTHDDVIITRRTVFPSLLMGGELKETPDQLPNDCIARYYGKSSVILAPKS